MSPPAKECGRGYAKSLNDKSSQRNFDVVCNIGSIVVPDYKGRHMVNENFCHIP
jgi:hypothetical protein